MQTLKPRQATTGSFTRRVQRWSARFAFLALSGMIVVAISEKVYWYPSGVGTAAMLELAAFYSLPIAPTLFAIHRYRVNGFVAVGIASAIFALGVEGIITPVLYEDGPLPVMALYFLGWHGAFAFVFGWYGVRRWALEGRYGLLTIGSLLHGAVWGLWSTTYWRPETIAEQQAENAAGTAVWDYGQWPVSKFAAYVGVVTAMFVIAHWLLGFVWPQDWAITRRWRIIMWVLLGAGLALMTIIVPFAPIKMAVLGYPVLYLLRRNRESSDRSLFVDLQGRIPFVRLLPAAITAPAAIGVYAVMAAMEPSEGILDTIYGTLVMATLGAGVLMALHWTKLWAQRALLSRR